MYETKELAKKNVRFCQKIMEAYKKSGSKDFKLK